MRKSTLRIITLIVAGIAAILIAGLLVLTLSPAAAAYANTPLVQVLLFILCALLVTAIGFSIFAVFAPDNRVKNIRLDSSDKGKRDVTAACVKRVAIEAANSVEGASIKNVRLTRDFIDDIHFSACLTIKAKEGELCENQDKPCEIIKRVTAAIELEVMQVFDLEFRSIDIKLTGAKHYGMPTSQMIDERVSGAPLFVPSAEMIAANVNAVAFREQECMARENAVSQREAICADREARLAALCQQENPHLVIDTQDLVEQIPEEELEAADITSEGIQQTMFNQPPMQQQPLIKLQDSVIMPIVIPCGTDASLNNAERMARENQSAQPQNIYDPTIGRNSYCNSLDEKFKNLGELLERER